MVSDQVRHQPGCTATEEAGNFGFRKYRNRTVRVAKTKSADQLRSYFDADLRLCVCLCKMLVFSLCGSILYILWYIYLSRYSAPFLNISAPSPDPFIAPSGIILINSGTFFRLMQKYKRSITIFFFFFFFFFF